jgi:diphthamide synthase (EF-2-diphthine--ammonia ligase)
VKVLVSWSSGKDSAWMVHVLGGQGTAPAGLLTTINESAQRVAMHAVRVELLEAQAASLGLPLTKMPIPTPCSNEQYEAAMRIAVSQAIADGFTHLAFADLFLADIRQYREEKLAGTGLTPLFPLFTDDSQTPRLARDMIAAGLRRESRASTRSSSTAVSPAANSTRRSSMTCRRRSIRAASAASFTRSRTMDRCSAGRSPSKPV